MAMVRLWFVVILAVGLFRDRPFIEVEDDVVPEPSVYIEPEPVDHYVPVPEREWFSFLDQETGIWKEEYK